jgi:hypothetical protein
MTLLFSSSLNTPGERAIVRLLQHAPADAEGAAFAQRVQRFIVLVDGLDDGALERREVGERPREDRGDLGRLFIRRPRRRPTVDRL